jgi:polyhydroxyalkanoate synthase subunit PhaC
MAETPGQVWFGDTTTMTMETSKETTTGEARGATPQGELKLVASTPKSAGAAAKTGAPPPAIEPPAFGSVDVEAFSRNLARVIENGGKALAAYMKPREEGKVRDEFTENVADIVKTVAKVLEFWLSDPQRSLELQTSVGRSYLDLWASAMRRLSGEEFKPIVSPDPKDKRFADPEWSQNQFYDFLKQLYLLTVQWSEKLVQGAEGIDDHTRQKAEFYIRQFANAISPSNFVLTNPELLRETMTSNAENLARGMAMLSEDIEAGEGNLRIRQTDPATFAVGKNLALTPGKVIYQNDLMQLVQYESTTDEVFKVPLLIVPPWINKFYILDLTPEKSFIKWCVDRGFTVFVISWVNPNAALARKSFEEYMKEGPLTALDIVEQVTGEKKVHTIGYCVGGTLLAVTLAYLAANKKNPVVSATMFAAQVDFTYAGDLKIFVDEERIKQLEARMQETGYLEASRMANTFNMLRSNDLVWPYVVNNYLRGKKPYPFDLLYWNSDATRMPAANHSFYLRNCYLNNRLTKGEMEVAGTKLKLSKVKVPIYNLATREDHIAPAKSVMYGSQFFGGPVRYVLAGSGHIAGVINPPGPKIKYQYWTGDAPKGDDVENWLETATEHPGSWWPDWLDWIRSLDDEKVPARVIGGGKLTPIEDAPGSYVKMRS